MALGDAYVTAGQIAARTGKTDDGTFSTVALAASRVVERYTGRQFNKDTDPYPEATARRFVAADRRRLPVDDFHTLDDLEVTIGSTLIDAANIDPRPWDGIVEGQIGWPYFDLFRVSGAWPLGRRPTVTVTTPHWGWAEVPEVIGLVTLDAAAELVNLAASGEIGPVRSESIDGYSVAYLTEMFDSNTSLRVYMRNAYRRRNFGVA